jgi:hypothetical protein
VTVALEHHARTRFQALPGVDERTPRPRLVTRAHEEALGSPAAWQPATDQTRRKDAGVVDDEQIAAAKEAADVGDVCVLDLARRTMQDQQARGSTRRRLLRDQFFGKLEIEVVYAHGATVARQSRGFAARGFGGSRFAGSARSALQAARCC